MISGAGVDSVIFYKSIRNNVLYTACDILAILFI